MYPNPYGDQNRSYPPQPPYPGAPPQPAGQAPYPQSDQLGFGGSGGLGWTSGSSSAPYPPGGSVPYPPSPGVGFSVNPSPYPAYQASPIPPTGPPIGNFSSPYPSGQTFPSAPGNQPFVPPPQQQSYPNLQEQSHSVNPYGPPQSAPYGQQVGQFAPAPGHTSFGSVAVASTAFNPAYSSASVASKVPYNPSNMQMYQETPSIKPCQFDPSSDAAVLRKAMKGFGTDEAAIINILAKRTNAQRMEISRAFKASYGKDLIKDLKSELGGRLEEVVLAMMTPLYEYLAKCLEKAMSGIGTKEKVLVDILCTATNQEMMWINQTYHRMYNRSIEKDLTGDTSGHFRRLLVSMTTAGRNEQHPPNQAAAAKDAQDLYQAGEKKWGTDESTFNMVLATRSFPQLRMVMQEYEKISKSSLEKAIASEFSGDVKEGLLAVVRSAHNRAAYFAARMHDSVAGFGTKDDDLIMLCVTRAEIDMENIKQEYQRMYGKSLASAVSGDTSGDYKKILLALIG